VSSLSAGAGSDLAADVALCGADEELLACLREVYARLEADIDSADLECRACGHCCLFDRADHTLFVSTGELALLASQPVRPGCTPRPLRCAYQVDSRCTARDRRPLGCRVFFCSQDRRPRYPETYETLHRAVRAAHQRRKLPYRYVELTAALAELFRRGCISVDSPRPNP